MQVLAPDGGRRLGLLTPFAEDGHRLGPAFLAGVEVPQLLERAQRVRVVRSEELAHPGKGFLEDGLGLREVPRSR